MLLRAYREMSQINKELIVKLFLCTLISAVYSCLVGDIYSVTAVVTANLFLYVDRGYCGSLRYAARRVLVQVVQGALVLVIVLPCKYWLRLPVPDIAIFTAASLFGIAVGMPINYKYRFSPLNATLANATFIIAIGVLTGLEMLPYRVLHCVAGGAIGYVVNFVIMPQRDRYQEALRRASAAQSSPYSGARILSSTWTASRRRDTTAASSSSAWTSPSWPRTIRRASSGTSVRRRP